MAIQPKRYETLYLVRPDMENEKFTDLQDKLTKVITSNEGEVIRNEKWDERTLAYPINKYTNGIYHILVYISLPKVVSELEKLLNLNKADVLRFMTTLSEEEQLLEQETEEQKEVAEDQDISAFQSATTAQGNDNPPDVTDDTKTTTTGGDN